MLKKILISINMACLLVFCLFGEHLAKLEGYYNYFVPPLMVVMLIQIGLVFASFANASKYYRGDKRIYIIALLVIFNWVMVPFYYRYFHRDHIPEKER